MLIRKMLDYINPVRIFKRERESNVNLRMMHGVNRISVWLFLFCLGVMLWRWFAR
jgi:hypothetical protein